MPDMTAEQIRATLTPMIDFAPAILKAADIVESAEKAEKALAKAIARDQSVKAELLAEIDRLHASATEFRLKMNEAQQEARAQYGAALKELEIKKAEISEVDKVLVAARQALAEFETGAQAEKEKLTAQKQALQKQIEDLKASYEQWKKDHGLA